MYWNGSTAMRLTNSSASASTCLKFCTHGDFNCSSNVISPFPRESPCRASRWLISYLAPTAISQPLLAYSDPNGSDPSLSLLIRHERLPMLHAPHHGYRLIVLRREASALKEVHLLPARIIAAALVQLAQRHMVTIRVDVVRPHARAAALHGCPHNNILPALGRSTRVVVVREVYPQALPQLHHVLGCSRVLHLLPRVAVHVLPLLVVIGDCGVHLKTHWKIHHIAHL